MTYPQLKEEVAWQGMASGSLDTVVENWGHDDLTKKYITDGKTDRLALEATHDFGAGWTAKLGYSYSRYNYSDNQARVISYDHQLAE